MREELQGEGGAGGGGGGGGGGRRGNERGAAGVGVPAAAAHPLMLICHLPGAARRPGNQEQYTAGEIFITGLW